MSRKTTIEKNRRWKEKHFTTITVKRLVQQTPSFKTFLTFSSPTAGRESFTCRLEKNNEFRVLCLKLASCSHTVVKRRDGGTPGQSERGINDPPAGVQLHKNCLQQHPTKYSTRIPEKRRFYTRDR